MYLAAVPDLVELIVSDRARLNETSYSLLANRSVIHRIKTIIAYYKFIYHYYNAQWTIWNNFSRDRRFASETVFSKIINMLSLFLNGDHLGDKDKRNKNHYRTHLNPHHHVQVTLAVLFNDVTHIVWFPSLLKLSASHKVFDLPDCPDSIPVCFCQSRKRNRNSSLNRHVTRRERCINYFFHSC